MSDVFRFPTAEEITRDWGVRCPNFDQDCGRCQMWATYDMVKALEAENGRFRKALEYYAKTNSWRTSTAYICGHFGPSSAEVDRGDKARAALELKP